MLDAHGDPVLDENGEPLKRTVKHYDEPGIEGESVTLTQWYFDPADGTWKRNERFGHDAMNALAAIATDDWAAGEPHEATLSDDGRVTLTTNGDGLYNFKNLPTAYVDDAGAFYLASYRQIGRAHV